MDINELLLDKKIHETDKYIYFLTTGCQVLVFEKKLESLLPQLKITNMYCGLEFLVSDISDDRGDYFLVNNGKEIEDTTGIPVDESILICLHEDAVKKDVKNNRGWEKITV